MGKLSLHHAPPRLVQLIEQYLRVCEPGSGLGGGRRKIPCDRTHGLCTCLEEACQMKQDPQFQGELRDVAPGLWVLRLEHPRWKPRPGWEPLVSSTRVESPGE